MHYSLTQNRINSHKPDKMVDSFEQAEARSIALKIIYPCKVILYHSQRMDGRKDDRLEAISDYTLFSRPLPSHFPRGVRGCDNREIKQLLSL